jgi:hypothetical protein
MGKHTERAVALDDAVSFLQRGEGKRPSNWQQGEEVPNDVVPWRRIGTG